MLKTKDSATCSHHSVIVILVSGISLTNSAALELHYL